MSIWNVISTRMKIREVNRYTLKLDLCLLFCKKDQQSLTVPFCLLQKKFKYQRQSIFVSTAFEMFARSSILISNWARAQQNQQNDLCAQWRLRSALASSLTRVFPVHSIGSYGPTVSLGGQQRLWLDWVDAQADPSLRRAHKSFCCFCHAAAHIFSSRSFLCLFVLEFYGPVNNELMSSRSVNSGTVPGQA